MLDLGIELYVKEAGAEKFPSAPLVAVKGAPATGQAAGTVDVTTSSDPVKVYIADRPDTGAMDFTYNYSTESFIAVKAICDNTLKDIMIKYPDGTGALYTGVCQTWRNEVSVGGIIECTLHTVPNAQILEKTSAEVSALMAE